MMKAEATTSNNVVAKVMGDENLLYEVLKRADGHSLARVECVCRKWREIARDERFWELICKRHLANIGFIDQQSYSGILALGGFRWLHSFYLWPLSKMSTYLLSPFPCPLPRPSWLDLEDEVKMSSQVKMLRRMIFDHYDWILQPMHRIVNYYDTDATTVIHVDGKTKQTATTKQQIKKLLGSLRYSEIEIDTKHSLESCNLGTLVMVSGSLIANGFSGRRNFVQISFLLPKSEPPLFYILNDIFQLR